MYWHRFRHPLLGFALLIAIHGNRAIAQNPNTNPLENQAQKPVEGSQPAASMGVNTGGAHEPVLDAQHRPITAGGFVASGPVVFKDSSGPGSSVRRSAQSANATTLSRS